MVVQSYTLVPHCSTDQIWFVQQDQSMNYLLVKFHYVRTVLLQVVKFYLL